MMSLDVSEARAAPFANSRMSVMSVLSVKGP